MRSNNFELLLFCMFGLILGMIIIIAIFVVLNNRYNFWIPFQPTCIMDQYINNPSTALQEGYKISDILFIDKTDLDSKMIYKRPVKSSCVPGMNQNFHIKYPQYCDFITLDSNKNQVIVKTKDEFFGANRYKIIGDNGEIVIKTNENCISADPTYTSGNIVYDWN